MKPREFWGIKHFVGCGADGKPRIEYQLRDEKPSWSELQLGDERIHLIEKSAYDRLHTALKEILEKTDDHAAAAIAHDALNPDKEWVLSTRNVHVPPVIEKENSPQLMVHRDMWKQLNETLKAAQRLVKLIDIEGPAMHAWEEVSALCDVIRNESQHRGSPE